jgi:hypothetical protein
MTEDDPRMERFIDAVQAAYESDGTTSFETLVTMTLQMVGKDFLPHLRPDAVLLPDRVVVAWRYGFTGAKKGTTTVLLDKVTSVAASHFPSGPRAGTRVLAIRSGETLKLAFPPEVSETLYAAFWRAVDVPND